MKRMLFNATQSEELRVAIVDGQRLIDLDIEHTGREQRKSNIYKAVITRIEPSLEAAFVDYGQERHGFLPFKEIATSYYLNKPESGRARIQDVLKEGVELLVQVDKDERGNKGAALTTFISLAGRYLVLMPNNPRGGGVSRRIEGEDRDELRDVMAQLEVPKGMSMIARTAGIGRNAEELQWDLNYLTQLWAAIDSAYSQVEAGSLIYLESSLMIRAVRDYFQPDINEILIDDADTHFQVKGFMDLVMPSYSNRVKHYTDDIPLFTRFQIEHQIETAFSREVRLPSGGAIVIDHTEALVSVDVNSGRSIKGADIEHTAFNTNCEAADEVARQMRLRDLGGLVVIDFIDMEVQKNQREVETRLKDALHFDRARVQMGKISRFGLMELSRQRLRPSLGESNHIPCPRCSGTGHIRGIESTALHILRITQEEAMKENSAIIQVQLPVETATFLLNEKRADIHKIEERMGVQVVLIPNIHMETPNYNIVRVKADDVTESHTQASYTMVEMPIDETPASQAEIPKPEKQQAAVKGITPMSAAPNVAERIASVIKPVKKISLFTKIKKWFAGTSEDKTKEKKLLPDNQVDAQRENQRGNRNNRNRNRNRNERNSNEKIGERLAAKAENRQLSPTQQKPQQNRNIDVQLQDRKNLERINQDPKNQEPRNADRNNQSRNPLRHDIKSELRDENPEVSNLVDAQATSLPVVENNLEPRERGRRSRNGRRDRNRGNRDNTTNESNANASFIPNENLVPNVVNLDNLKAENTLTEVARLPGNLDANQAQLISETKVADLSAPKSSLETIETKIDEPTISLASEVKALAKRPARPRKLKAEVKIDDVSESSLELIETATSNAPFVATISPATRKPKREAAWKKSADNELATEPLVIVQTQKE